MLVYQYESLGKMLLVPSKLVEHSLGSENYTVRQVGRQLKIIMKRAAVTAAGSG